MKKKIFLLTLISGLLYTVFNEVTQTESVDTLYSNQNDDKIILLIEHCTSWGYATTVEEIRRYLTSSFKNVEVIGEEYPISTQRRIIKTIIFIIQISIILLCVLADNVRTVFPFFTENYIAYIRDKRWKIGLLTFILGNQISAILSSTGAFEIYCNNIQIFSKLKTNTMPNIEFIVSSITRLGFSLHQ